MFTIHKLFNEKQGTLGWVVVFDNTEVIANFVRFEDATLFADSKEREYVDAKEALLNAYSENMH